jgi:hypothetical protein
MARKLGLLLGVSLVLAPIALATGGKAQAAIGGDWRQFRAGANHSGVNRYETSISRATVKSLQLKWVGNNGFNSSPAVVDGVVYISNGGLHAYPANCRDDGGVCPPLWHANSSYADWSSPAVARGIVYIQGVGGLFAYKVGCRHDGGLCSPIWSDLSSDAAYTSPTVGGGKLFVVTSSGFLKAYDTNACEEGGGTCSPVWKAPLGGEAHSSPAVADGIVYLVGADHMLRAFKVNCGTGSATCSPIWTADVHAFTFASPAISGGALYIGTSAGRLFVFPTSCRYGDGTCQPLWRARMPVEIHSSAAVTDTTVFVGSGRRLFAFSVGCATDGRMCDPLWRSTRTGPGGGFASSPAVANGLVFVGSQEEYQSNGKLLAYRANCATGGALCQPIWESPMLGGMVNASPAVSNGMVFVASNGGQTFAFGLP